MRTPRGRKTSARRGNHVDRHVPADERGKARPQALDRRAIHADERSRPRRVHSTRTPSAVTMTSMPSASGVLTPSSACSRRTASPTNMRTFAPTLEASGGLGGLGAASCRPPATGSVLSSAGTMMSMHSITHSLQMNTPGPAMSLFTSSWNFPQKLHRAGALPFGTGHHDALLWRLVAEVAERTRVGLAGLGGTGSHQPLQPLPRGHPASRSTRFSSPATFSRS